MSMEMDPHRYKLHSSQRIALRFTDRERAEWSAARLSVRADRINQSIQATWHNIMSTNHPELAQA